MPQAGKVWEEGGHFHMRGRGDFAYENEVKKRGNDADFHKTKHIEENTEIKRKGSLYELFKTKYRKIQWRRIICQSI